MEITNGGAGTAEEVGMTRKLSSSSGGVLLSSSFENHQLVFVGGLPHSGIGLLTRYLDQHPLISGIPINHQSARHGEHLQSVFPPANTYGGLGSFAFSSAPHLTEGSGLVSDLNRTRLLTEWGRHWDLSKPTLMEVSPANLIRTRFLQALFPEARFIISLRDPVAVALAMQRQTKTSVQSLIEHWLICHEWLERDRQHVQRLLLVRYEALVKQSQATINKVLSFLQLEPRLSSLELLPRQDGTWPDSGRNQRSRALLEEPLDGETIIHKYEDRVAAFGYSLRLKTSKRTNKSIGLSPPRSRHQTTESTGPDFLIIGAMKAGTTSLFKYLTQHPNVAGPIKKELHFFTSRYERGTPFYESLFPDRQENSLDFRQLTGEATPYYLFHPHVPGRVARHYPQAKLIILLRNPVERAHSHYQYAVRKGRENLSFEEALLAEPARMRCETERLLINEFSRSLTHAWHSYTARGIYIDQLLRWERFFPQEQMLILKSEDMFVNPVGVVSQVVDFLRLPSWLLSDAAVYNSEPYRPMKTPTRERLLAYFSPFNQRLYEHVGRDFGWQ